MKNAWPASATGTGLPSVSHPGSPVISIRGGLAVVPSSRPTARRQPLPPMGQREERRQQAHQKGTQDKDSADGGEFRANIGESFNVGVALPGVADCCGTESSRHAAQEDRQERMHGALLPSAPVSSGSG